MITVSAIYYADLVDKYLRALGAFQKRVVLESQLLASEYYPGILSIVECLYYSGIECEVIKSTSPLLPDISCPVIVQIEYEKSTIFATALLGKTHVRLYNPISKRRDVVKADEFTQIWTGVIIFPKFISEKTKNQGLRKHKRESALRIMLCLALAIYFIIISPTVFFAGLGFCLSLCLIKISFGTTSHVSYETWCKRGAKIDCEKVQRSRLSKLLRIPLSYISLVYFAAILLAALTAMLVPASHPLSIALGILSVLPLVIVPILILYQWLVVKAWCLVCLLISAVILVNAVYTGQSIIYRNITSDSSDWLNTDLLLISFLLISIVVLHYTTIIFARERENRKTHLGISKLLQNTSVLSSLFHNNVHSENEIHHGELLVGDKHSPVIITTLISPRCNKCKDLVKALVSLLRKHPESFRWDIRLDGVIGDRSSVVNQKQYELFCSLREDSTNECLESLSKWCDGIELDQDCVNSGLMWIAYEAHLRQNRSLGTGKVPAIWVNGKEVKPSIIPYIEPFLFRKHIGAL